MARSATLITALAAFSGIVSAADFSGTGQIRAVIGGLGADGLGDDVGCITDAGLWTQDESLCGTFTTTAVDSLFFSLASAEGNCAPGFECGADVAAWTSWWAWSGLLDDGRAILAKGESITYSSGDDPAVAPAAISIYSTSDPKPWIWLTWSALFWRWLAKFIPPSISPSVITCTGLAVNMTCCLCVLSFTPDLTSQVPSWPLYLCSLGVFLYQTFDGLDGKQSFKVQNTQIEEVSDHGCDAISAVLMMLGISAASQLGSHPSLLYLFFPS